MRNSGIPRNMRNSGIPRNREERRTLRREPLPKGIALRSPVVYPIFIRSHSKRRSNSARKDIPNVTPLGTRASSEAPTQALSPPRAQGLFSYRPVRQRRRVVRLCTRAGVPRVCRWWYTRVVYTGVHTRVVNLCYSRFSERHRRRATMRESPYKQA